MPCAFGSEWRQKRVSDQIRLVYVYVEVVDHSRYVFVVAQCAVDITDLLVIDGRICIMNVPVCFQHILRDAFFAAQHLRQIAEQQILLVNIQKGAHIHVGFIFLNGVLVDGSHSVKLFEQRVYRGGGCLAIAHEGAHDQKNQKQQSDHVLSGDMKPEEFHEFSISFR